MHATLRRIKTQPGQTVEVARLIEAEYLPQIEEVDGFISYTLVDLGDDEISSVRVHQLGDPLHRRIAEAIESRSPAAARAAMDEHLAIALRWPTSGSAPSAEAPAGDQAPGRRRAALDDPSRRRREVSPQ